MATPPQLSDHIAVCCLLDLPFEHFGGTCEARSCQYKPKYRSLKDFFQKKKLPASIPVHEAHEQPESESPSVKKQRVETVVDD
jgi:hypothetical protein